MCMYINVRVYNWMFLIKVDIIDEDVYIYMCMDIYVYL